MNISSRDDVVQGGVIMLSWRYVVAMNQLRGDSYVGCSLRRECNDGDNVRALLEQVTVIG